MKHGRQKGRHTTKVRRLFFGFCIAGICDIDATFSNEKTVLPLLKKYAQACLRILFPFLFQENKAIRISVLSIFIITSLLLSQFSISLIK